MPANLTPDYLEAERRFREAKDAQAKIEALEEMLSVIPKHKGTEKLQADLKSRLAKLRAQPRKKGAAGRHEDPYHIPKEGAAQLVLVGPPNSGKSAVLKALTHADPEVTEYPFATRKPLPGMMTYENIQIQLIDTPSIDAGFMEPFMPRMVRLADGVLLVVDGGSDDILEQTSTVLEKLENLKIRLAGRVAAGPEGAGVAGPMDKKTLLVCTRSDREGAGKRFEILRELTGDRFRSLLVSTYSAASLETLKKEIFDFLEIIRVYTKTPGKKADLSRPYVFPRGTTVIDASEHVHKDFREKFKFAKIWGSEKYDGQMVQRDFLLQDGDVIEFHI
jgi:ribosome-interacting GTPase 1